MITLSSPTKIEEWYSGWDESMLWSYFQNVMGTAYADHEDHPKSAVVYVNCFGFAAGKPDVQLIQDWYDQAVKGFAIIVARDEAWHAVFEEVGKDKCRCVERYAIKKEPGCFDTEKLTAFVKRAESEYRIVPIDEVLYDECRKHPWSEDLVQGYESYEEFKQKGLGFVAVCGGKPVAGASSYSSYKGGIEVEVDTKEEYRRRGLATSCAARLIMECMKKGLYPSWDAQNKWSVALAEKLGYHYSHTYFAYEIWKN